MCKQDNRIALCGLVSGGRRSCNAMHHSVFTRVSQYRKWIKEQIEGEQCLMLMLRIGNTRHLSAKYGNNFQIRAKLVTPATLKIAKGLMVLTVSCLDFRVRRTLLLVLF